jgi:hypothetical protein
MDGHSRRWVRDYNEACKPIFLWYPPREPHGGVFTEESSQEHASRTFPPHHSTLAAISDTNRGYSSMSFIGCTGVPINTAPGPPPVFHPGYTAIQPATREAPPAVPAQPPATTVKAKTGDYNRRNNLTGFAGNNTLHIGAPALPTTPAQPPAQNIKTKNRADNNRGTNIGGVTGRNNSMQFGAPPPADRGHRKNKKKSKDKGKRPNNEG